MSTSVKIVWMRIFYSILLLFSLFHRRVLYLFAEIGWIRLNDAHRVSDRDFFICLGIELLLLILFVVFFDRWLNWTEYKKTMKTAVIAILVGGFVDYFDLALWPAMVIYLALAVIVPGLLLLFRWLRERKLRGEMQDGGSL